MAAAAGQRARMPRPVAEEPSARALREEAKMLLRPEHIARFWLAVGDDPPHGRCLARLLCLLPLRREELTRLTWGKLRGVLPGDNLLMADAELFQGPRLELKAARMKGRRPQVKPLPPAAVALLREAHETRGADGPHVFSASAGRSPHIGWRRLAAGLREVCRDMPSGWVVHDIRGGIATAPGEAGEDEAVIARLLHHAPAARIGVTARYDRSRSLQPMLDALALWEAALLKAVAAEERRVAAAVT
jgi:integrase